MTGFEIDLTLYDEAAPTGGEVTFRRRHEGTMLCFDGRCYHPFDGDPKWLALNPRAAEHGGLPSLGQRRIIEGGVYTSAGGDRIDGRARQRVVDRLLGVYDSLPTIIDPTAEEHQTRAYIPGLWFFDTMPALVGPKGWGKTKLVCQFCAALIIPGRRFLGYFEPMELTHEERRRDVWLIVPETRVGAIHDALLLAGLVFTYRDGIPCYASKELGLAGGVLIVQHLQGRASEFDLTDEAKRVWWADYLVEYTNRPEPPIALVVDGITAILRNDTGRYGSFTSALGSLRVDAGIPNVLGVLHSPMGVRIDTPMNGIESMGEWDGMWLASAGAFPVRPSTSRTFYALPREGDPDVPERRIVMGDDGMLQLVDLDARKSADADPGVNAAREALRQLLRDADPDWLWTKEVCGTGDLYTANKKELEAMEREGQVISRPHSEGRTRGYQWRLSENALTD